MNQSRMQSEQWLFSPFFGPFCKIIQTSIFFCKKFYNLERVWCVLFLKNKFLQRLEKSKQNVVIWFTNNLIIIDFISCTGRICITFGRFGFCIIGFTICLHPIYLLYSYFSKNSFYSLQAYPQRSKIGRQIFQKYINMVWLQNLYLYWV